MPKQRLVPNLSLSGFLCKSAEEAGEGEIPGGGSATVNVASFPCTTTYV
jgi:hypothetical protein